MTEKRNKLQISIKISLGKIYELCTCYGFRRKLNNIGIMKLVRRWLF